MIFYRSDSCKSSTDTDARYAPVKRPRMLPISLPSAVSLYDSQDYGDLEGGYPLTHDDVVSSNTSDILSLILVNFLWFILNYMGLRSEI